MVDLTRVISESEGQRYQSWEKKWLILREISESEGQRYQSWEKKWLSG